MPRSVKWGRKNKTALLGGRALPPLTFNAICDEPVVIEAAAAAPDGSADETTTALPRFKMTAYTGGLMSPRGYYYPVVAVIEGMKILSQNSPVLRDHDTNRIVGDTDLIEIRGIKVYAEGDVSGVGDDAQEVAGTGKNGFPWQASCGWTIPEGQLEFVDKGIKTTINGKTFTGPLYIARQSLIREISFVVFGADNKTTAAVEGQSSSHSSTLTDPAEVPMFEEWLKAQGFDSATLNDSQKKILQAAFDNEQANLEAAGGNDRTLQGQGGETVNPPNSQLDLNAIRTTSIEAIRTEQVRIDGITRICAQFQNPKFKVNGQEVDLRAHAIQEGWDHMRTELEARREARPAAPAGHAHSHEGTCTLEALQGAMLLRAGMTLDNPRWNSPQAQAIGLPTWLRASVNAEQRQRSMEAAYQYRDMSLVDLCREANRLDAQYVGYGRTQVIQAAFSGGTLSQIFTTNIGAAVLEGYMRIPDTTAPWTRRNMNVQNFMPQERFRLKKKGAMQKLARGEKARHKSLSDTGEQYKIARYAEQLVLDEQDIIDDRFQVLMDSPLELSADAADLVPALVYAILLSNPAMADGTALFAAGRSNLNAGKALNEANLKTALTGFRTIQENGVTLDLTPTDIIVPAALEFTADGLIRSGETRIAADTGGPTLNTLQGKVRNRISDARLDNGVTDPDSGTAIAGSSTDWYVTDRSYPPIEVGFLVGTGGVPSVRSFVLDRGQFGLGWDIKLDVGAKAIRAESIQKNEQ